MKSTSKITLYRSRALVLALSLALALGGFGSTAFGETVGVFYNSAIPQHVFAAGDIRAALEARKMTVEVKELSALSGNVTGKKIVIALASEPRASALFESQGVAAVENLGDQAYAMRTTTTPAMSYWVPGGDANGAMYGALQIAKNITF